MDNKKHFDEILTRTNLAFIKSPTKGVIFWYNILLPDSKINSHINEKAWQDLKETFIKEKPDQIALVEQVIIDLKYIRKQILEDDYAKKKVEELKKFLVQNIVSEDIIDSLQEYVFTNYDKIKNQIKSLKK